MTSDPDIMRYMNVSHQQIVIADRGQHPAALGAPMNCHEFAYAIAAPDLGFTPLTVVLQVLRGDSNSRIWIEQVVFADNRRPFDEDVPHQARPGADLDIRAHDRIR